MKFPGLGPATDGDAPLLRAAAITFIGAIVIVTLHVGRDVLEVLRSSRGGGHCARRGFSFLKQHQGERLGPV